VVDKKTRWKKGKRGAKNKTIFLSMSIIIITVSVMLVIFPQKIFPDTSRLPNFMKQCYFNSDCDWQIINCCPENAGAFWQCANLKNFTRPDCSSMLVLCPQVISPKPETSCGCEKGNCVER